MYNRPLIYYLFFVILGCLGFLISLKSDFLCLLMFLLILIPFFFTLQSKKFFIINILFILLGFFSFNLYFNINVPNRISVKIVNKNGKNKIFMYKGRKITFNFSNKNLNINKINSGMNLEIYGVYKKNPNYDKGIIGKFSIKKYSINKNDLIFYIDKFKNFVYKKYNNTFNKNQSSILMALCCGDEQYLSYNQKNNYKKLGIVHILCVSGFHISIIYSVLKKIFKKKMGAFATFFYVVFTGLKASAIRAYFMIILYEFSKELHKNYDSISALCFIGLILILVKPYYILDLGFNLSFLATLGIILYYKKISKFFYKFSKKLNESISVSLSAQVFTIPYIAFTLNNVSINFLFGNIILVPIYSFLIVFGNISILFLNISKIFNLISYIIKGVFTVLILFQKILLDISVPMIEFNKFYAISMIFMYLYFIFVNSIKRNKDIIDV